MNIERILRYVVIGGLFLIPFIPFIVANSMFFPFITGKNFAFRILVEIVFAAWVILAIRNPQYRPTFSWIGVSVALFLGIIFLADLFGVNASRSIWSNFERMEGFVTLAHLGLYFVILATTLNTKKLWLRFFNTTVGASVLMAIFGLFQLSGLATINQGGVRLDGRFGNATYLAIYMVFHIFITLLLLLWWRGKSYMYYVYGAIVLLQGFILYHTATRGAILGLLGGLLLAALLIVIFERERVALRKASIGVLVAVLLVVGGFFAVKDARFVENSPVLSRFASISVEEGTVQSRFLIWNMAWQGIKERPLLGYGQDNFNVVFNQYYDPVLFANEPWFDRVHNIVFDWLVSGGILGFLAYISMPLFLLWYVWFGRHGLSVAERSLFVGLIAAYGFHNLFVFDNTVSYLLFFTILAYGYYLTRPHVNTEKKWGTQFDTGMVDRLVLPIVVVAMVLVIHSVNTKHILAATTLIDAIRSHESGLETNLEFFRDALAYESLGNQEAREQLAQMAVRVAPQQGVDPVIKQELFDLARGELEAQIEESAPDARLELFLASLFDSYGFLDQGATHYERAQELSPNKQTIRFARSLNMLNRGDGEEALTLLQETVALEPSFDEAHLLYAVGALFTNNTALADQILNDRFGTPIVNNDRLLQAYLNNNMFDRVRGILELRSANQPQDINIRLQIAATYLQAGDQNQAIVEIESIIEDFPDFKEQGEAFIEDIRSGNLQ